MPDFFKRLRERRIVQIVVSVAAAGWIALEVANSLIERGILPDLVYRIGLIAYLGGIVASLIVGWHHGEKGHQKVTRGEVVQLTVVFLVTVVAAVAAGVRATREPSIADASRGLDLRRVAVLYFQDLSGFGELQYLADGLTEGLIDQLAQVRSLDVVSRNGSEAFRNAELRPDSIARALEAATLVDGSIEKQGDDELRVNVRLLDGSSGAEFQRGVFEAPADDPDALRQDLAEEVSRFLREWLGEEIDLRRRRAAAENNAAWLVVQRAERVRKDAESVLGHGDVHAALEQFAVADSLLAEAESIDPAWAEPTTLRAGIAYRTSRILGGEPHEAEAAIEEAVAHADRALEKSPNAARAMATRGTALYFRWLIELDHDPDVRARLLDRAQTDLETAVRMDPSLAGAHSTLSHLYYQVGDVPQVVLAARRAYEEDAFLDVTHDVLWRLYLGSYDLEQFGQARRWCDEGRERFPDSYRFVDCELWLLAIPGNEPDPDSARTLAERIEHLAPEHERALATRQSRMIVGAVLGRAGMVDSARSVMLDARAGHEIDPYMDLVFAEAFARTLIGDEEEAIRLLQRYVAGNPGHTFDRGGDLFWAWRPLQDEPGFQAIAARSH